MNTGSETSTDTASGKTALTSPNESGAQIERRFETLANLSPAGIFRTDASGACNYVNPAWCRIAGLTADQAMGYGWQNAIYSEDAEWVAERWAAYANGGGEWRESFRFQWPDGQIFWVDSLAAYERDASGKPMGFIGTNVDISESKALEESLIAARRSAEAATEAKSRFLANMSHEIRTPMNGVIGFTQLLLDGQLGDEQRGQVQMILESGNAMMRLLNDVLDLSKIEAGQLVMAEEQIDLPHLLDGCARLMTPAANSKGLDFTCDLDIDGDEAIVGSRNEVRQIVLNLLGNAIKFTADGAIRVSATIEPAETTCEPATVAIDVTDSGPGIAPHRQDAIFDPFEQANDVISRQHGGTGLGLTISRQLANKMGGSLEVQSEPGTGSTFQLRFPATNPDTTTQETPMGDTNHATGDNDTRSAASVCAPAQQRKGRILLAEDHDINQILITAMIERLGYTSELANDGAEAVAKIDDAIALNEPYNLVLMDVRMPVMGGMDATRMIRASGVDARQLPIIAVTANAFQDDIDGCLSAGMQAHIAKPVMFDLLRSTLSHWISTDIEKPDGVPASDPGFMDGELAERYRTRKRAMVHCLTSMVRNGDYTGDELREAADHLHKLAGTAAMFGDAELGIKAKLIEHGLTLWKVDERDQRLKVAIDDFVRAA